MADRTGDRAGEQRLSREWPRRAGALAAVGALLACLVAAFSGCGSEDPTATGDGKREAAVTVEVLRIEARPLRDVATFSGQLDAEFSVVIKSEIEGVIESIEFEEGQKVARGDTLIRLRDGSQKARLREAVAKQALAEDEFRRTQNLVTRDAASEAKKDRAAAELEIAKARVDRARVELARTELQAPFDGVVGFRAISPGSFITENDPLVTVDAVERLQLSFAMSDRAVAFARPGMRIEARVAPYPGERFPGEVYVVSPNLDPATRRLILKAWVPNAEHRLRPGMFADVDLEVGRRDAAIVVPEAAIAFDHQGTFVWRVTAEDFAERVPVETGLRKDGIVEVTMGLRPGDTIVVAGTHKVSEGSKLASARKPAAGQALRRPDSGATGGEGT